MEIKELKVFLDAVADSGATAIDFERIENEKRTIFETTIGSLSNEDKKKIRESLDTQLVDKKGKKKEKLIDRDGQEYAADTFGSVRRGHSIAEEDWPEILNQMKKVFDVTRAAIDKAAELKKADGTPVYPFGVKDKAIREKAEKEFGTLIELEVFTPMVREGLIPETLVPNAFSEVQKLLDACFKSYRGELQKEIEDEFQKEIDDEQKLHQDSGRLHAVKKLADKGKRWADSMKESILPSEETMKKLKIAKETAKLGYKMFKAQKSVMGWIPDEEGNIKAVTKAQKFLEPSKFMDKLSPERLEYLESQRDPTTRLIPDDFIRTQLEYQRQEDRLVKSFGKIGEKLSFLGLSKTEMADLGKNVAALKRIKDEDWAYYSKAGLDELVELITGVKDVATGAVEIRGEEKTMDKAVKKAVKAQMLQDRVEEALEDAIEGIDDAIVKGIDKAVKVPGVGSLFEGGFAVTIDQDKLLKALAPDPSKEDDEAVPDEGLALKLMADAIETSIREAAPKENKEAAGHFAKSAQAIAKAFLSQAAGSGLTASIPENPLKAFVPIVAAAGSATEAMTVGLKVALADPLVLQQLAVKNAMPNEEEALEELRQSEEEIREFEKTLTLIDEAGITAAEQRSIEVLIADLRRDKQILEMVLTLGNSLTGLGAGATDIANWATTALTDIVAGQITGALRAAQLIIQLAVNAKKAADRWTLWYKFQRDLERSKKAVSSLTSTIQGFVNNKEEQIAFHEIEDALLQVQLAATILQTIPEPHVLAIGTTLAVVNGAAQQAHKVAGMIYNEAKLAEGWATTKAAMQNTGDRALGLKALRLNTTLAMHAIAWAALEKQPPDPIARMMLNSLGISEQTLALDSTDESKVRAYLEELLDEDRKFKDVDKINVTWAPTDYKLCVKDWFTITSRAESDAVPKLAPGNGKAVLAALKLTDKHTLEKYRTEANVGGLDPARVTQLLKEIEAVIDALNAFAPQTPDRTTHIEMSAIADKMLKLARDHKVELMKVQDLNNGRRDPAWALTTLENHCEFFVALFGQDSNIEPTAEDILDKLDEETNNAMSSLSKVEAVRALDSDKTVQAKIEELKERANYARFWVHAKRNPGRSRRTVRN